MLYSIRSGTIRIDRVLYNFCCTKCIWYLGFAGDILVSEGEPYCMELVRSLFRRTVPWNVQIFKNTYYTKIFISVFNQLYVQNLFHNKYISCLYMFRAHVLIIRRSKLHYTAFGIITPIGGHTATYRCDDTRSVLCTRRPPIGVMIPEVCSAWDAHL